MLIFTIYNFTFKEDLQNCDKEQKLMQRNGLDKIMLLY